VSRRLLAAAALVLALAACKNASSGPAFRFDQPSSLALFWGLSAKHDARLHPYVAVANSAKDELVLFDPVDDLVVPARILIRPLSIPVLDPRPALVASTRFTASDGTPHSDLLVTVSAGATSLQLVRTWAGTKALEVDPGLASDDPVDLGSQVEALVATPVVDGTGAVVEDRAWVIAALVDGRLAVVEYQLTLAPDTDLPESISAVSAAPTYQSPGFEALSLAVDPRDQKYLYAATLGRIAGVQGVAQLDLRGAVGAWSMAALNAHAPTRLVAAFSLRERNLDVRGAYDQVTDVDSTSTGAFQADRVSRVYAYLDPGSCGPTTELPCGVAVLDPATGDLLEDPWHTGQVPKRYLRPIAVPAQPVAMVIGTPPANAPSDSQAGYEQDPFMYFSAAGQRITTGLLLLPSDDGRSYFADLARWEVPSNSYELYFTGGQRTQVSSFRPSNTDLPQIGFYCPTAAVCAKFTESLTTTSTAAAFITLTPGFTPSDLWSVTYQGVLPDFVSKHVTTIEQVSGTGAATQYRVALQASTAGGQVVNVYDPAYGVRVGDIVQFWTSKVLPSGSSCPDTPSTTEDQPIAPIEGKIIAIEKPDALHRGGSLLVMAGDCVPVLSGAQTICDSAAHGPYTGDGSSFPGCWGTLGGQGVPVTIRAQGGAAGAEEFVVIGTGTGYAGRATRYDVGAGGPVFQFTNDGEAALVAACPLIPWPAGDPLAAADCSGSCRLTCEQAAISRRARRHHLTSAICVSSEGSCTDVYFPAFTAPTDGPPSGPVIAFKLDWTAAGASAARQVMIRDTQVIFATHSGYSPASRYGAGVNGGPGTHPMGAVYFDRSQDTSWDKRSEGYRFFVSYVGDVVLDVSPAHANSTAKVLR
jgi:hypothetical protein